MGEGQREYEKGRGDIQETPPRLHGPCHSFTSQFIPLSSSDKVDRKPLNKMTAQPGRDGLKRHTCCEANGKGKASENLLRCGQYFFREVDSLCSVNFLPFVTWYCHLWNTSKPCQTLSNLQAVHPTWPSHEPLSRSIHRWAYFPDRHFLQQRC